MRTATKLGIAVGIAIALFFSMGAYAKTFTSVRETTKYLHNKALDGKTSITLYYYANTDNDAWKYCSTACYGIYNDTYYKDDGKSKNKKFDYIFNDIYYCLSGTVYKKTNGKWKVLYSWNLHQKKNRQKYKMKVRVFRRISVKAEHKYNSIIKDKIKDHGISKGSNYSKVKKAYNFVIKRVKYSKKLKYKPHLAYSALVRKKAVCDGYSMLLYDILRRVGVPCRVVYGKSFDYDGNGYSHAWNLIKLKGKWYHADVTWDDDGGKGYDWFLKGTKHFKRHKVTESKPWYRKYKVAKNNY